MFNPIFSSPYIQPPLTPRQLEEKQIEAQTLCVELIANIRLLPRDEEELFKLCDSYEQLLKNPTVEEKTKRELFKEITFLLKTFPQDHLDVNRKLVSYLLGFCEFGMDITKEVRVLIHVHAKKISLDQVQREIIASNLAKILEAADIKLSLQNYCWAAGNQNEQEFKERLEKLAWAAQKGLGDAITLFRNHVLNAANQTIPLGDKTPFYYQFLNARFKKEEHVFFPEHLQNRLNTLRSSFETKFNNLFPNGVIKNIDSSQVRELQKEISQEFTLFLQDLTALPYLLFEHNKLPTEIHVAGSLAREEVYPFSDFEGMILFDDLVDPGRSTEQQTLLRSAAEYISLLVAGIGETMALPIEIQPLIASQKGFALDALFAKPPSILEELNQNSQILLATAGQIQSLQKAGPTDEETRLALYSLLKTKAIVTTPQAALNFEGYMLAFLNETIQEQPRREHIALRMIQEIHLPHYRACFAFKRSQGWVDKPYDSYEVIDIKNQFIKTLFHALTTLSIYYGIEQANILDIVDELERKKLFTPESISLLNEAVSSIYLIRLKMHLAFIQKPWNGSYDEARVPNRAKETSASNNNAYPLQEEESSHLEKSYWLVLKPLYYCLQQIEKVGNAVDLLDVTFSTILNDILHEKITPCAQTPFIQCFVKYLVGHHLADKNHFTYYQRLSTSVKFEPLRKAYLDQEAL